MVHVLTVNKPNAVPRGSLKGEWVQCEFKGVDGTIKKVHDERGHSSSAATVWKETDL